MQLLYELVKLRAESIKGQLDGTIPSTDAGQRKDSSSLIDASHIDIKAMGQFNMGGNTGSGFGFDREDRPEKDTSDGEIFEETDRKRPSFSGMPGQSASQTRTNNLIAYSICMAVMLAALAAVKCYRRGNR